jgi:hypothetical protein
MFAYASTTVFPGAIGFSGSNGFRDIVLLRRERGKLRVVEDIDSSCNGPVYSGAHPGFKPRPGESVREQMIDLLLTPGVGATDLGMIQAIFDFTPPEISPEYTAKALLKLAASPSPVIRTAACLQFRDLLAEKGSALSDQFGVSRSDLKRWQAQEEQNTPARFWWGHGPLSWAVPTTPLHAGSLTGMDLCTNDKALGVPPLRSPSAATEFRPSLCQQCSTKPLQRPAKQINSDQISRSSRGPSIAPGTIRRELALKEGCGGNAAQLQVLFVNPSLFTGKPALGLKQGEVVCQHANPSRGCRRPAKSRERFELAGQLVPVDRSVLSVEMFAKAVLRENC